MVAKSYNGIKNTRKTSKTPQASLKHIFPKKIWLDNESIQPSRFRKRIEWYK